MNALRGRARRVIGKQKLQGDAMNKNKAEVLIVVFCALSR
jgi:hypothetical protein